MINLLLDYQKHRRDQSDQISNLDRNNQLNAPGEFKKFLQEQARLANVSPRMIEIQEKADTTENEADAKGGGAGSEVKVKQASISLKKVNLTQLKAFLNQIEFAQFNLSVASIKVTNDDKIRGYMNVEIGVVGYLFQADSGDSG